jgi:glyoxylase I family protein
VTTTPPFSLVGLDHVVFLVDDMPKALKFYREVLGCQPGYSYPNIGMEQLWCGSALIVLWDSTHPGAADAAPPVEGGRNVDHVCIALSPFDHDAMRTHLRAGMGNSFYVFDPFGNKLELKGPPVYPDGRAET